jgi:hypothetical protein
MTLPSASAVLKAEISTLNDAIISLKKELAITESADLGFELAILGDRLVVMSDPLSRHGWKVTAYIGFVTKKDANAMIDRFTKSAYECKKTNKPIPFLFMELRESERVFEGKWELKIIDLHQSLINKLCKEFGYAIRNNAPVESVPIIEPQKPLSKEEIEDIQDLVAIAQKATIN